MHVFVGIQDAWSRIEKVVKELSHQKGGSLVLFARGAHLVLELNIVLL